MSALLLPLVAVGGIYLAVDAFTRKNKKSSTSLTTPLGKTDTQKNPLHRKKSNFSLSLFPKKSEDLFSLHDKKVKTRKHVEKKTRKLFVFYSFREKNKDWDYKSLPSTWILKRRVHNVNRTTNFNNVDLFQGDKKYQEEMRHYLEKAFSQLKANGIVKEYKIRGINVPL